MQPFTEVLQTGLKFIVKQNFWHINSSLKKESILTQK